MRLFKFVALAIVIAFAAQGFGSVHVQAQSKVIKIASQSPLSGSQSVEGVGIRNGADLAIQQLAKPIEDMGYQVQFVPFDDQATADVGVANAHNIVNDAAILAVIGHYNSGVAIPSSEVYNQSDLVMVSPANTNPLITDRGLPTVNRVCGRDDTQGRVGAEYAFKTLGIKSVYILDDQGTYGVGVAKSFNDNAKALGIEVRGFQATAEKANFDALLTPIVALAPDAIYFGSSDVSILGSFWKQARAKGIKAQFLGPDGNDSPGLADAAGDAIVGLVYTTTAGPASLFPDAKQFISDYKAAFKLDVVPYAAESYAATQITLSAIESVLKANGGQMPTRKDVATAVRATKDFKTIVGNITFDANGDPVTATYYVLQVGSSDSTKWGENKILTSVVDPSPLAAQAMASATMSATMAATAAQ